MTELNDLFKRHVYRKYSCIKKKKRERHSILKYYNHNAWKSMALMEKKKGSEKNVVYTLRQL